MKLRLSILLLTLTLACLVVEAGNPALLRAAWGRRGVDTVVVRDGLATYYKFSGNANDYFGVYNGAVSGATLTNGPFSTPNTAYYFNGSSSYIDTGYTGSHTNFSISVWINTTQATYANILAKNNASPGGLSLFLSSGKPSAGTVASTGADAVYRLGSTTANDGNWHHVVAVYTISTASKLNNDYSIYIDGVLRNGTIERFAEPAFVTNSIYIGKRTAGSFYSGRCGATRLYNRLLTSNEVVAIYNAEKP